MDEDERGTGLTGFVWKWQSDEHSETNSIVFVPE